MKQDINVNGAKKIPFLFSAVFCFLFCLSVFFPKAGASRSDLLSDNEKRSFMESSARPFSEKRVFYRWLSREEARNLISQGEWGGSSYARYMRRADLSAVAGAGLYVAEDTASSSRYGPVLIQVEVEETAKYLNLLDEGIIKQLEEKGITAHEVYTLNPGVAVKYTDKWWVLKGRKGVKFSPFFGNGLSLRNLEESYIRMDERQKGFFKNAVKDTILKRADRDISVFFGPFVEIMETERGRIYVKQKIADHPVHLIKTVREGTNRLKYTGKYLNDSSKRNIAEHILTLPVVSMSESADFLLTARDSLGPFLRSYLSSEEITSVVEKTPFHSVEEGRIFLTNMERRLSPEQITVVVEKILPYLTFYNEDDMEKLLSDIRRYISEEDEQKIRARTFHISNIFPEEELTAVGPAGNLESERRNDFPLKGESKPAEGIKAPAFKDKPRENPAERVTQKGSPAEEFLRDAVQQSFFSGEAIDRDVLVRYLLKEMECQGFFQN